VAVSALVFPELTVEIDAFARLGADLRRQWPVDAGDVTRFEQSDVMVVHS
jgi:hypothetical protein